MNKETRWFAILAAALLAAAGCARVAESPSETVPEPGATFDLAVAEIVDLSHTYGEDTLYWPTSPSKFELEVLSHGMTEGGFFYAANSLSTPEHGGTHLDAPIHFAEGRWASDEIPVDRLIGPGVVIDVSAQAAADADYRLTRADVEAWEALQL